MRKSPFKNVHDIQQIARKAFEKVTPEIVSNIYDHVKKQENYYKDLHGIEPLLLQDVETLDDNVQTISEPPDSISEESILVFDEDGQVSVPVEAETENIVEAPDVVQPYFCTMCDYNTLSLTNLNRHLKSHYLCNECGKSFKEPSGNRDYKTHLKSHQPTIQPEENKLDSFHTCSFCEKSFMNQSFLNCHIKRVHSLIPKEKTVPVPFLNDAEDETLTVVETSQKKDKERDPFIPENQPRGQKRKQTIQERHF